MALKPLKPVGPDAVDYSQEIARLTSKIDKLVHEYELYFSGILKLEPQQQRKEVMSLFAKLTGEPITNQTQRFQLGQIKSKFQSYNGFWTSTLRKIEEGTYHRDRYQQKVKSFDDPDAFKPPPDEEIHPIPDESKKEIQKKPDEPRKETPPVKKEPTKVDRAKLEAKLADKLYGEYVVARLEVNESLDGLTPEWFRSSLVEQRTALASKYGDSKEIGFKVVVQDGKAKVKAVLKNKDKE